MSIEDLYIYAKIDGLEHYLAHVDIDGMNEKRFVYKEEPYHFPTKKRIRDTQNNETDIYDLRECCELLNKKQVTIEQLKSVLRKQFNIITDKDLLEYVNANGVSLNE